MRASTPSRRAAAKAVMATPSIRSIARNGSPAASTPLSWMRAMFG